MGVRQSHRKVKYTPQKNLVYIYIYIYIYKKTSWKAVTTEDRQYMH